MAPPAHVWAGLVLPRTKGKSTCCYNLFVSSIVYNSSRPSWDFLKQTFSLWPRVIILWAFTVLHWEHSEYLESPLGNIVTTQSCGLHRTLCHTWCMFFRLYSSEQVLVSSGVGQRWKNTDTADVLIFHSCAFFSFLHAFKFVCFFCAIFGIFAQFRAFFAHILCANFSDSKFCQCYLVSFFPYLVLACTQKLK